MLRAAAHRTTRRCGMKAVEGHRSPRRWRVGRWLPNARSVLECASPLALWAQRGENGRRLERLSADCECGWSGVSSCSWCFARRRVPAIQLQGSRGIQSSVGRFKRPMLGGGWRINNNLNEVVGGFAREMQKRSDRNRVGVGVV